ncbi:MAG: shikimate dehydrogenase, partial [Clostridia bacterium]|nr:shikimate dehydrogenase [Clostridia bacterium]
MKFGLIGRTLKHSYSKIIHEKFSLYPYDLYEVEEEKLGDFVKNCGLDGFNVTIPYKKSIIPYLDELDGVAKDVGAVNTVVKRRGKLIGYNTDVYGMEYMLEKAGISLKGKKVAVLGSGGTGITALNVAKRQGARETVVLSRDPLNGTGYDETEKYGDADVLINATPVGMYPHPYSSPINSDVFKRLTGVVDVIYNPAETLLLYNAKKRGIPCTNGLNMLVAQAKKSAEIFTGNALPDNLIERVVKSIEKEEKNVLLVGMAGVGK